MAQRSYFFDSVDHDRIYTAADFARVFGAIAGRDGVIYGYGDELKVTPGSGMAVKVGTGAAFVQGRMLEVYGEAEVLPVEAADAVSPRIDRVVVRLDLTSSERRAYLAVKTGTPAATPAAPLLQQDSTIWELSLAQVRVPAGATGIVVGDIADEREFTSLSDGATAATTLYTPGVAGLDVATVQAGLDVLAGSRIVEMGSNSNGTYVRGENGLQVCMAKVEVDFTSTGFKNFPYPAEFFDSPWGGSFAAGPGQFSSPDDPSRFSMSTLRLGTNAWEFRVNEVFSQTNRPTRFFAIGRWK